MKEKTKAEIDSLKSEKDLLALANVMTKIEKYAEILGLPIEIEEERNYIMKRIEEVKAKTHLDSKYLIKIYQDHREFYYKLEENTKNNPARNLKYEKPQNAIFTNDCLMIPTGKDTWDDVENKFLIAVWFCDTLEASVVPQEVVDYILKSMPWKKIENQKNTRHDLALEPLQRFQDKLRNITFKPNLPKHYYYGANGLYALKNEE